MTWPIRILAVAALATGALSPSAEARHSNPDEACWWGLHVSGSNAEPVSVLRPRFFEGCEGPKVVIGASDSTDRPQQSASQPMSRPAAKKQCKKRKPARRKGRKGRKRGRPRC